jgi:uncharacterized protein YigA (DUF484 family)
MTTASQPRKRGSSPLTDEKVEAYLREHPEFFMTHGSLLEIIRVPHHSGTAISLIERQVSVLREKNARLQEQLAEIIEIACDNDVLNQRLHQLTLVLLASNDADTVLGLLEESLHQYFQVDRVIVCSSPGPSLSGGQPDNPLDSLLKQGEAWCGGVDDTALAQSLFGETVAGIRSFAVTPLDHAGFRGLLVLGSRDPDRFKPGMGLLYLRILGEIVAARLSALLSQ